MPMTFVYGENKSDGPNADVVLVFDSLDPVDYIHLHSDLGKKYKVLAECELNLPSMRINLSYALCLIEYIDYPEPLRYGFSVKRFDPAYRNDYRRPNTVYLKEKVAFVGEQCFRSIIGMIDKAAININNRILFNLYDVIHDTNFEYRHLLGRKTWIATDIEPEPQKGQLVDIYGYDVPSEYRENAISLLNSIDIGYFNPIDFDSFGNYLYLDSITFMSYCHKNTDITINLCIDRNYSRKDSKYGINITREIYDLDELGNRINQQTTVLEGLVAICGWTLNQLIIRLMNQLIARTGDYSIQECFPMFLDELRLYRTNVGRVTFIPEFDVKTITYRDLDPR